MEQEEIYRFFYSQENDLKPPKWNEVEIAINYENFLVLITNFVQYSSTWK